MSYAQTSRTWSVAEGDYSESINWSPAGTPAITDPITIAEGTATASEVFTRAASTTLSGGTLDVTGFDFANASTGAATLSISAGQLIHSGAVFSLAMDNEGTFIQTGGSVTSNTTDGWYLSNATGSKGVYELTGGDLTVYTTSTAVAKQIHIGLQSNGDLFHIDGGTANFSGSSTRRFYTSTNSILRIDSGTLNADNLLYFVVGRVGATNVNSLMEVNGGAVNMTNIPDNGAFIVGGAGDGLLQMNGGTIATNNGALWISDGAINGTVNQTGGEIDLGTSNLTIARASTGRGCYQMSGGKLTAGSIVIGNGASPQFAFQGGQIVLSGDQTDLLDASWFYALSPVETVYDAESDTTTFTATPVEGKESTYQYYRFTPTRLRDRFSQSVQMSEFNFLLDGVPVSLDGVTVDNGGAETPEAEGPDNLVDGDVATKWYQAESGPLVFTFPTPVTIDGYRFYTANDAVDRDPQRWTLEGSSDGETWEVIDRVQTNYPTPVGRKIATLDVPLPTVVPEEMAITSLDWIGDKSSVWNDGLKNWYADEASVWIDDVDAIFGEQGETKAVTIDGAVAASLLEFDAAGYSLSGGSISVSSGVINTNYDATIGSVITGTPEIRKGGDGILELTGQNTFTGKTNVRAGSLIFSGTASSTGNGGLLMSNETGAKTVFEMNSSGSLTYTGSALIGNATDSVSIFHQTSGMVTSGSNGAYFTVGNGSNAYAEFRLDGGTFQAYEPSPAGIRVGFGGSYGSLVQTGGTLNCPRYLAIGSATGTGMASFLSGNA
ncbi:discoidin domain-containing protein, partial [Luteolibacter pohnpeiensis]